MALKYLVDTNIISEPEKTTPNAQVVRLLTMHKNEIALASISWHELFYGYHCLPSSKRKERVGNFIKQTVVVIPILPYEQLAAEWFAKERARLSQMGLMPAYADGQIAAIAATNNLILVTRNTTDFAQFTDINIEDWF